MGRNALPLLNLSNHKLNMSENKSLVEIKKFVSKELASPEVMKTLVATTFKGLSPEVMPQAIVEGMIRGFTFNDFLEKNIYAIPYGQGYSLITSIDHARKIGMRSGVIGKSAPSYETDENGKIISCTITIKKQVNGTIGDFTETVYFNEYSTNRNLWLSKPRTMIAKVAEMHALRMACPEELSQSYVEEEVAEIKPAVVIPDFSEHKVKLEATKNLNELKTVWASLPAEAKKELTPLKDELKNKFVEKPEPKNERV